MRKTLTAVGITAAAMVAGAGAASAADAPDVADTDVNAEHALDHVNVTAPVMVGDVVPVEVEDSVNGLTTAVLGGALGGN